MAVIPGGNQNRFPINVSGQIPLGDMGDNVAGTMTLQFVVPSAAVVSIVVKARSRNPEAAADSAPFLACQYVKIWLNGAAGDQTYVNTAITSDSLILVPATGMAIELDVTFTSGLMYVYVSRSLTAAA